MYVTICASNMVVVGGILYHFGKGGRCGLYCYNDDGCRADGGDG